MVGEFGKLKADFIKYYYFVSEIWLTVRNVPRDMIPHFPRTVAFIIH